MKVPLATRWALFVAQLWAIKCGIAQQPPNIVILMADDLGYDDVSCHGSNLWLTPNIDALMYNSVILNDFHTPSLCTPSRAALMTGKYPIFTGMQRSVILESEPWGLPLSLKILPQYLNSVGYESFIIGKWHLGFFDPKYTPTFRGFKYHFGFWQGHHDYFTHQCHETFGDFVGYDFRENLDAMTDLDGLYTSDLLSATAVHVIEKHDTSKPLFLYIPHIAPHAGEPGDPLQAPEDVIERFAYIEDEEKRKYSAMVSKLDDCVGDIMTALNEKNMLGNTIVLFMTDNGAPTLGVHANTGSNYPFRGIKGTELEGGTRAIAALWSPLFKNQRVSNNMMHMVDVLPTLCTAAGVDPKEFEDIDGISMWETLLEASDQSPRNEILYNIDPSEEDDAVGAVRTGEWKYYQGDATGNTEAFQWPGSKYPHSEFEKYYYDTVQIIHSRANNAIVDFYKRNAEITDWEPLNEDKILGLREAITVQCPRLENLPECDTTKSCLFNLKEDPCERYDYSDLYPEKLETLRRKFEETRSKVVKPLNKPRDICANPEYWAGIWSPWYDFNVILENMSMKGKYKRSMYLYAFAWHYGQSAFYPKGDASS